MRTVDMTGSPYAPPAASLADTVRVPVAPPLWNPNAAANWSLLFTPAFGAFLHLLNWRALGENDRAASAKAWFVISLVLLAMYVVLGLLLPDARTADGIGRAIGFVYLIVWYVSTARSQARYVKDKFGSAYPRKGWTRPLLIALAAMVGYIAFSAAIGFVFGLTAGR